MKAVTRFRLITAVLLNALIMNAAFADAPGHLPIVTGKDLNHKPWTAPNDFPGTRTLVLLAFVREQQADVDTWTAGLGLDKPNNTIPWIEMPLINNPGMFMRWFINTGMRGGIPSEQARAHVWTVYTDKKAFMEASRLPSEKEIYALVVDRAGAIIAVEAGGYSKPAADRLLGVLGQNTSPQK